MIDFREFDMDIAVTLTIIGIVVAIIIGIWQIWLTRKQIHLSKTSPTHVSTLQETNTEKESSSAQADNHSIAVGKIEVNGPVSGSITIGNSYPPAIEANISTLTNNVATGNKYRERPYPHEIIDEIDQLPVFQKEQGQSNYVGLKVRWHTTLSNIIRVKDNNFTLMMRGQDKFPWVCCEVDVLEYPE